eukprot:2894380-Prymnesium_polylepis.1
MLERAVTTPPYQWLPSHCGIIALIDGIVALVDASVALVDASVALVSKFEDNMTDAVNVSRNYK